MGLATDDAAEEAAGAVGKGPIRLLEGAGELDFEGAGKRGQHQAGGGGEQSAALLEGADAGVKGEATGVEGVVAFGFD